MKKLLLASIVLLSAFSFSAQASEFGDLREKVSAARASLVTMMTNKDKRDAGQQKLVKDTANAVSAAISKMKAPVGKEAQFKEMVETWGAFKKTRETELVPLLIKGKDVEAKEIGGGIQKDRYKTVQELIDQLDQ